LVCLIACTGVGKTAQQHGKVNTKEKRRSVLSLFILFIFIDVYFECLICRRQWLFLRQ
jgi:hypothetical protein